MAKFEQAMEWLNAGHAVYREAWLYKECTQDQNIRLIGGNFIWVYDLKDFPDKKNVLSLEDLNALDWDVSYLNTYSPICSKNPIHENCGDCEQEKPANPSAEFVGNFLKVCNVYYNSVFIDRFYISQDLSDNYAIYFEYKDTSVIVKSFGRMHAAKDALRNLLRNGWID